MTADEANILQQALGDQYEVFEQWGVWVVRLRNQPTAGLAKAEDLYRQLQSRSEAPSDRLRRAEARPLWNELLADVVGLEDL